jgi:uncharacterized repeat protein (TIGR03847 family)
MTRSIHVFRTPDRFVAGTVGQPGNRTFYLQAVHDKRVVSVELEKQQVAVLAERIGAPLTVTLSAGVLLLCATLVWLFLPRVRALQ